MTYFSGMRAMTRIGCLTAALFFLTSTTVSAQTAELLEVRSTTLINGLANTLGMPPGIVAIDYDVAKYRVTYPMEYNGATYEVSGALFVPVDGEGQALECAFPTHTYMHGTIFLREDAPSYEGFEGQLGFLMATNGVIALMPDYLGLGSSTDVLHPYVHADSEAEAGIAMLGALENLQDDLGIGLNGQHFVSGYSQGGHASMAMAKRMQEDTEAGFPLAAAAPMSGPYDMSGTQLPAGMAQEQYSNPAYLAYILLAWQQTYGNIFVDLSEVFQEPFASGLPAMFDGETDGDMINDYLDGPTVDIVQPGALEGLMAEDHPFFLAAQDNDLYQWVPQSPIQMYYCTLDEQVFYDNTLVAEAWMNENGATEVTTVNGGPLNHGGCALLAILGGTVWINGQADVCNPTSGVSSMERDGLEWRPTDAGVAITGLEAGEAWRLYGLDGRVIDAGTAGGGRLDLVAPVGMFILQGASGRTVRLAVR